MSNQGSASRPVWWSRTLPWFLLLLAWFAAQCFVLGLPAWVLLGATGSGFPVLVWWAAIYWVTLPQWRSRDLPPAGIRLDRSRQARLYEEVNQLAGRIGMPPPEDIYLSLRPVVELVDRYRPLRLKAPRYLLLGLPCLAVLSRAEFHALVLHELAHDAPGEAGPWGPWMRRVHQTVRARLATLPSYRENFTWPNYALWRATLGITKPVARLQEAVADRLAAGTAGAGPLLSGLRLLPVVTAAFEQFLQETFLPVMQMGKLPPLAAGFRAWFEIPERTSSARREGEAELSSRVADPLDSHAPFEERASLVGAKEAAAVDEGAREDEAALGLLEYPWAAERELLEAVLPFDVRSLDPLEGEELALKVYVPLWEAMVAGRGATLRGLLIGDLPSAFAAFAPVAKKLLSDVEWLTVSEREQQAAGMVAAAVALVLHRRGWYAHSSIGRSPEFEKDGVRLNPLAMVDDLWEGRLSGEDFTAQCREAGIAGFDLGEAEP